MISHARGVNPTRVFVNDSDGQRLQIIGEDTRAERGLWESLRAMKKFYCSVSVTPRRLGSLVPYPHPMLLRAFISQSSLGDDLLSNFGLTTGPIGGWSLTGPAPTACRPAQESSRTGRDRAPIRFPNESIAV